MFFTMLCRIFHRFVVFFKPVPTSSVLLGEENEALLHLAGQRVDFYDFLCVSGFILEPLGCPLGTFFNTWDPTVSICRILFLPFLHRLLIDV